MDLRTRVNDAIKDAMRSKEADRLSTLRLINAAIKDKDISLRADGGDRVVGDDDVLAILGRMVKQRQESAKTYDENGRPELAEREREEISIISEFMPQPLSDTEMREVIASLVKESGATCLKNMGQIMGQLKKGYAGRIDMGKAGAVVKEHLGG